jgi:N6-L-threonylcarbamoyladenine synthase
MLGIETSCDDTAAAVVEEIESSGGGASAPHWILRSNVVASQADIHREWGGVVPELASRQHVRDICGVVERALEQAGTHLDEIGGIAVTEGPGLVGSLLVGVSFAKSLAAARKLPLVPVHHLAGHIESLFLQNGPLALPSAVLVVSGGHTSLYLVTDPGVYRLLGRTRDDAAGEAYDKVAKLLGLGYPGGPIVDRLARQGNDRAIDLPLTRITHADRNAPQLAGRLDFSYSGLKTAVLRHVESRKAGGAWPPSDQEVADLCASFQRVVVESLLDRLFAAADQYGAASAGIAGGVSANSRLRADALARGEKIGLAVYIPSLALSTDNAAMIAAAGLRRFAAGVRAGADLNADASLTL